MQPVYPRSKRSEDGKVLITLRVDPAEKLAVRQRAAEETARLRREHAEKVRRREPGVDRQAKPRSSQAKVLFDPALEHDPRLRELYEQYRSQQAQG